MSKLTTTVGIQLNDISLLSDTADPRAGAGVVAPVGSKYWMGTANSGDFTKTGAGNTAWTIVPTGIYFNVKDYGASGDGVTDDRAAIQLAIDDAAVQGGTIYFPPGTYLCGKNGTNPYSFVLNNVDFVRFLGCGWGGSVVKQSGSADAGAYDLFRINGGSNSTEFDLMTFDQSGLTNAGADLCHIVNAVEATIVKVINCRFTGGVATAGAYVHVGGTAGLVAEQIWITGCDMRDAGGPCVWFDSETKIAWLLDSTLINTIDADTVVIDDTASADITDVKIMGCRIENSMRYAIRGTSATLLQRLQIANNLCLGFVDFTLLTRSQIQQNEIYVSVAAIADACVTLTDCSEVQFQKNIVGRESTAAAGLILFLDTCTRMMLQGNPLMQEVDDTGVIHALDCSSLQIQTNVVTTLNAGSTVADAYLIEAVAVVADNIQITHDNITADAGEWANAVHILSNGANIGVVQVNPGVYNDCDIGVLFDHNGSRPDAAVFTDFLMVSGGVIQATTNAFDVTVTGVYIRVAGNASTFGPNIIAGNGTPDKHVTARIGSMYMRLDGGAGSTLYIKESGTGTEGWIAK